MDKIAAGPLVAHALRPYVSWSALAPAGCGFGVSTLSFRKGNWVGNPNATNGNKYANCVYLGHNANILYSICILSKYIHVSVGWLWIPDSKSWMIIYSWWFHPFFKILHVSVLSGSCSNHSPTYPPVYIFQKVKSLDNNSWLDRPCLFVFLSFPELVVPCSVGRWCDARCMSGRYLKNCWCHLCKSQHGICSVYIYIYIIIAGSLDDLCFDWIILTVFFAVPRPPKQGHLQ